MNKADLLIGIFWTKIGTPTLKSKSGSIEEIETHIANGKPALLYFSDANVPPSTFNSEEYQKVKIVKKSYQDRSIYSTYKGIDDFKDKLKNDLVLKINQNSSPVLRWILQNYILSAIMRY